MTTISAPDAERVYEIPRQRIAAARRQGRFKAVGSYEDAHGRKIMTYALMDVLHWASRAKKMPEANRPLIEEHLAALDAGEEVELDGASSGPPVAEGLFSAEQLERIIKANLPADVQRNAKSIAGISKAMAEMTAADTKQLRLLTEAGRLVDVKEVEILAQLYLDDWLAEVQDLPGNYGAEIAKRAKIPVAAARQALALVRERLLDSLDKTGRRIAEETDQFMRAKAKRIGGKQ